MALTYCTYCRIDHAPGEHQQSVKAPTRGRHLAPKPNRKSERLTLPTRRSKPRGTHRQHESVPVPADIPKPTFPTAEELGSSTAAVLRGVGTKTGQGISSFISTLRRWGSEATTGLREAIDVGGLSTDEGSKSRPKNPPSGDTSTWMERTPRGSGVGLLERGGPGLELSMLESLGFYSDDSAQVVTVAEPRAPGIAPSLPVPDSRSQVPDLDIGGWRPHVIARSKLGGGRLSSAAIIGFSVTLIVLTAMIASLLRAPIETASRQDSQLSDAATELAGSLSRLDAVMALPTGEVAESTSLLLDVDRSARDLFDLAASLPDDNASRQAAIGAAQSALAMETALGDALSYRVILRPLWDSPTLAGATDSTEAASMIATWQVELASMVESFPNSPALDKHIGQVTNFVAGFDRWRVRYLDALTAGDSAGAGAAEADLEGQLALLAQAGEETLGAIFAAADTERGRLIRALDTLAT
ncbi:MAG: hypothetical protein ACRDWA_02885 [Acidimicrobiia bacterium]